MSKSNRRHLFQSDPFSKAIVSGGYIANKIKKAGRRKAARKSRNLNRLCNIYNPLPAAPTKHARQRYKERGSSSTPVYQGKHNVAVVTYIFLFNVEVDGCLNHRNLGK